LNDETDVCGRLPEDGDGGDDGGHSLHIRHTLVGGKGKRVLPTLVGQVNDGQLELFFFYLK
jgi:hypothetical protein